MDSKIVPNSCARHCASQTNVIEIGISFPIVPCKTIPRRKKTTSQNNSNLPPGSCEWISFGTFPSEPIQFPKLLCSSCRYLQYYTNQSTTMPSSSIYFLLSIALIAIASSAAFTAMPTTPSRSVVSSSSMLFMAEGEVKAAPQVSGEELEVMLQDWDTPLVIDAYATWYVHPRNHFSK